MNVYDSTATVELGHDIVRPLKARLFVANTVWSLSTNAQEILTAMRGTFPVASDDNSSADLSLQLFVDWARSGSPLWAAPYFRSLDHLYFGTYGPADALLVDLLNRRVIGVFSPALACNHAYWKRSILPSLLGIVSASIAITPLHCACLVKDGSGMLIAGQSGAGKSTLSFALSLSGFDYLSDDCTYISRSGSDLRAWGLPTPVKLLPDAVRFFPELRGCRPIAVNGELALEADPLEYGHACAARFCEPRWLLFLERNEGSTTAFEPINSSEAAARLAADLELLPACLAWQREYQMKTIDTLVARQCWLFRYSGSPWLAVQELIEFCKR
jgi:hypothetical protein